MTMNAPVRALAILTLALSSCLEHEEEITVRPDGSVAVAIRAKGKPEDLGDGYAVPLEAPWVAENPQTLEWIRVLGSDTGSASVRANLASLAGKSGTIHPGEDVDLAVRAQFASAKDLPRFFAPESEPFRTAYLERATDLRVERKGGRTVYVLERTYRGRTHARTDATSLMRRDLDDATFAKLEDEARLTEFERTQVVDAALKAMRQIPETFASDALLAIYTQGDAALSPQALPRILGSVRAAVADVITREALECVAAALFPPEGKPDTDVAGAELERIDRATRAALRSSFAMAIEAEGAPLATRNALRGELEWLLTARDHTEDLGDESFQLRVRMPGTIVGGNFDGVEDGAATWKIDGKDMRDRDHALRVVSVVE